MKRVAACLRLLAAVLLSILPLLVPVTSMALTVGGVEVKGLSSISEEEFLDVLGIRKGGAVDEVTVRDGIKRAFQKGIFEDIRIFVPDGDNPVVTVDVRELELISRVVIAGNYEVPKSVIEDNFLLKEGQALRYDLVEEAKAVLADKLSEYGFPTPHIDVDFVKSTLPNRVIVMVSVVTGEPLRIRNIKLSVSPSWEQGEGERIDFFKELSLAAGDVYDRSKLDRGLKRIRAALKKRGHFRPAVGPYTFSDGELEIPIDPGKRLTVVISGNEALSGGILSREVPFFEVEDFNDEIVGEAIDRMLSVYHREGYPFAQVAPVLDADDHRIDLTFFIFEGERVKTGHIGFRGATLPEGGLRDVMSLKEGEAYNPDLLERDKEYLKEFYGALGYLDAVVTDVDAEIDREAQVAEITVTLQEGSKTVIGSIEILGAGAEMKEELMKTVGLKSGDPYNEVDISDARFRLLGYYAARGYTNIDVDITRNLSDHSAAIVFNIVEGKKRFFGKTVVTGNRKTAYEVIKRELLHKEDDPYSIGVLAEERQRLYKLGLFTDVQMEAIDAGGDRKDIILRVTEGNAGAIEFGVGYGEYEQFRGFFEVSYRNLWGMNRQGLLRTELSSFEQRFILRYNEPWFLGRRLPFAAFLLHENRRVVDVEDHDTRYKLRRSTATAGVEKKLSETVKLDFYYEFTLVKTWDVQPDVVLTKEDTGTLAISSIKPALIFDTRDNPFDPRKGVLAGISLKTASFLLLSESDFTKLEVYGSIFRGLSRRFTLALAARGGVAYDFGDTQELPLVERFFLGGRSSVRGYAQDELGPKGSDGNPTGGNAFLMGSVEIRTSVGRGFGVVPFFDMGNVWTRVSDIEVTHLKFTTGLGLRYETPVGPLRVDYGVKLNRDPGESRGELHFSIGHAF